MRDVALCNDQKPGRVLINAVDNSGTLYAADSLQLAFTMVQQRVDQCPVTMSCGGMDHQSSRLVHYDEVFVLIHDSEFNILRHCFVGLGRRDIQFKMLS